MDIAVRVLLWWLSIGSLVWLVLHTIGVVDQAYQSLVAAGRRPSASQLTWGSFVAILLWPWPLYALLRHPQWTFKHLKRKLWGAP